MDLKILFVISLYWVLFGLVFGISSLDSLGNPFLDEGYTSFISFNDSDFDADTEIETGGLLGFFSGISGIFVAMGRITLFTLFGFSPVLTGLSQALFSAWQTLWTIFTVGFVISAFWNG